MLMPHSKIPDGLYCYCSGGCPYYKEISHMKVKFNNYYIRVAKCEYLNIDTMTLMLEEDYYNSWLLTDECKICGVNMSGNVD